jgi:hypothetical protein
MRKNFLRQLSFVTLAAFALLISFSADANAQNRYYYDNNSRINTRYENDSSFYSAAWENGYRLGYGSGSNDRTYRSSYDVDRNKTYRDGDSGYRGEYGSKDQYKREFRDAYESGYRDGYDGRRSQLDYNSRTYGRNNNRNDNYYNRQVYRNNRNYPSQSCPTQRNNRGRGLRF